MQILNVVALKEPFQRLHIELRRIFAGGHTPDIHDAVDIMAFQQLQKIFLRLVGVPDAKQLILVHFVFLLKAPLLDVAGNRLRNLAAKLLKLWHSAKQIILNKVYILCILRENA